MREEDPRKETTKESLERCEKNQEEVISGKLTPNRKGVTDLKCPHTK